MFVRFEAAHTKSWTVSWERKNRSTRQCQAGAQCARLRPIGVREVVGSRTLLTGRPERVSGTAGEAPSETTTEGSRDRRSDGRHRMHLHLTVCPRPDEDRTSKTCTGPPARMPIATISFSNIRTDVAAVTTEIITAGRRMPSNGSRTRMVPTRMSGSDVADPAD